MLLGGGEVSKQLSGQGRKVTKKRGRPRSVSVPAIMMSDITNITKRKKWSEKLMFGNTGSKGWV